MFVGRFIAMLLVGFTIVACNPWEPPEQLPPSIRVLPVYIDNRDTDTDMAGDVDLTMWGLTWGNEGIDFVGKVFLEFGGLLRDGGVPEGLPRPSVKPANVARRLMKYLGVNTPWMSVQ